MKQYYCKTCNKMISSVFCLPVTARCADCNGYISEADEKSKMKSGDSNERKTFAQEISEVKKKMGSIKQDLNVLHEKLDYAEKSIQSSMFEIDCPICSNQIVVEYKNGETKPIEGSIRSADGTIRIFVPE